MFKSRATAPILLGTGTALAESVPNEQPMCHERHPAGVDRLGNRVCACRAIDASRGRCGAARAGRVLGGCGPEVPRSLPRRGRPASVQPDPKAVYTVKATDTTGFSISYDVEDESGVEWSVKIGDEAQSEVTASRIVWAMGYQQPPNAYLRPLALA